MYRVNQRVQKRPGFAWRPICKVIESRLNLLMGSPDILHVVEYPDGYKVYIWESEWPGQFTELCRWDGAQDIVFTIPEAAKILGISDRQVRSLISKGDISASWRLEKTAHKVIAWAELLEFNQERRRPPGRPANE